MIIVAAAACWTIDSNIKDREGCNKGEFGPGLVKWQARTKMADKWEYPRSIQGVFRE